MLADVAELGDQAMIVPVEKPRGSGGLLGSPEVTTARSPANPALQKIMSQDNTGLLKRK